jgi:hypothetical protein
MNKFTVAGLVVAVLTVAVVRAGQDVPKPPEPEKPHQWLQQLAGEWDVEVSVTMMPGQPPQKFKGTESIRTVGEYWIVAQGKSTFMDQPMESMLTLGYDPQKKKFVGTWIDSMQTYLWNYEGTLDEAGKTLTLLTEGPFPGAPGKLSKFKEVIELKSKDHKTFSSSLQTDDGKWVTFVTADYRRKK